MKQLEQDVRLSLPNGRVELRPLTYEDTASLFAVGNSADIWDYMSMRITCLQDMEKWVGRALEAKKAGTEYPFAIYDRKLGKLAGSTRYLDIMPQHKNLEIGSTWLSPEVWRTRINTECKFLLLTYALETLGAVRVQIKTDGRNLRSQQAIERIGAVKEGVLRKHRILPDGYIRDTVMFSIIREEWPTVRAKLAAMLAES